MTRNPRETNGTRIQPITGISVRTMWTATARDAEEDRLPGVELDVGVPVVGLDDQEDDRGNDGDIGKARRRRCQRGRFARAAAEGRDGCGGTGVY
jgi:hypothetical protein